ncbi:Hypothetical protein HVR_LOCUS161 [uncultured virus]|nr:Hypothetical protein HVR_LOCUS161 [uncultured virus]
MSISSIFILALKMLLWIKIYFDLEVMIKDHAMDPAELDLKVSSGILKDSIADVNIFDIYISIKMLIYFDLKVMIKDHAMDPAELDLKVSS